MNILLSCAGRRNYLIKYFKEALAGSGQVIAVDSSKYAPALYEADMAYIVPQVNHPRYLETLLRICKQNEVKMIIPLNDLELPILARHKETLLENGIIPIVSSQRAVDICFDKWKTMMFISEIGLHAPRTYLNLTDFYYDLSVGRVTFPVIVKPRWGSASIGIEFASDTDELEIILKLIKKRISRSFLADVNSVDTEKAAIIQEYLDGDEYGLDIVNNLAEEYVVTFVKRKLAMRAGETDRALTLRDSKLESIGKLIGESLKHVGNLDCDVIVSSNGVSILEMNPRFGGGYPFSHESGANIPAALIAWAAGDIVKQEWFEMDKCVICSKCDRLVVEEPGKIASINAAHDP